MRIKQATMSLALAVSFYSFVAGAADGTWTNSAGGSWANSANWSGGAIASGSGATADFSTLDLTANAIVTLDGAQTIGTLDFADTASSYYNWILNTGSGGPLTLAGSGTPIINVSSDQAVINAVLAGTQGFLKTGNGTLLLTAANTFTGNVEVGQTGDSHLAFSTPAAFNGQNIYLGSVSGDPQIRFIASGGDLTLTNQITVNTVRAIIGNDTVNGLTAGNQTWAGNVILDYGSFNDLYLQKNLTISGPISEATPGLKVTMNGPSTATLTLSGTNSYTGGTVVPVGYLQLACPGGVAVPAGGVTLSGGRILLLGDEQIADSDVLTWASGANNNSRFQLNGHTETIAGLQDNATGGARIVESAPDGINNLSSTLILNVPSGTTNTFGSYVRDGGASGCSLAVDKRGAGTQIFSSNDSQVSYSGATTIEQGTLEVDGTNSDLANSAVTLNGGTFFVNMPSGTGNRTKPITGTGSFHKDGVGNVVLQAASGNNQIAGLTTVDNGLFRVGSGAVLSNTTVVVNNGFLQVYGDMYSSSIQVNNGVLSSGATYGDTSLISGAVTNAGGIVRGSAYFDNVTFQSGTIAPNLDAGTGNATLTISNLTCEGGNFQFDLNATDTTTGGGVNDLVAVDTLDVTGPTTFFIPEINSLTGSRYVIMTYNTLAGGMSSLTNLYLDPSIVGRMLVTIDTNTPGQIAVDIGNPGATPESLTWVGGLNGNAWDVQTTTNWTDGVNPQAFYAADSVMFDDTGSASPAIGLNAPVYTGLLSFNNSANNYIIAGSGSITGMGINKTANGSVALNVPYTGGSVTNYGGGTLSLTNASISNLLENASCTTILTGTNNLSGTATFDTSDVGSSLIITNGGTVSMAASGGFVLPDSNNSLVVAGANAALNIPNLSAAIQVAFPGASSGDSIILRDGGSWTNVLNNVVFPQGGGANNNSFIITNGGRLVWSPQNTGSFLLGHGAAAYDNSLQIIGSSSLLDLKGDQLYSGRNGTNNVTTVDGGAITNCSNILINDAGVGQDNGLRVLNGGTVSVSTGVYVGAGAGSVDAFALVDNGTLTAALINVGPNGSATGSSLTITNNGQVTLSGSLTINNSSSVVNFSSGNLSLGSANVANGLPFTVGDGTGAATLTLNGGSYSFANDLDVSANATLTGTGTITGGNVAVSGSFQPGTTSTGSLTVNNNLTLAGTALMKIDKASSANDSVTVGGNLTYGGTLVVTNLGGTLAPGDTFKLFNFGNNPGSFTSVVLPAGVVWTNNLAVDGTIQVLSVGAPTLSFSNSAPNVITFNWTGSYKLQWQTNALNVGLNTNWVDYPGGGTSPVSVTNDSAIPSAFFRLSQ